MTYPHDSVGRVETHAVRLPGPVRLVGGGVLPEVVVAYETYGELTPGRDNAVLVCHALSGSAHAAGYHGHGAEEKPGWWDLVIGPGKPIDTRRYFVVSQNFLGSCYGTSGPTSVNPATGHRYGPSFPAVTVRDMVEVQKRLLDHLGVPRLLAVVGGSLGGMQALQWAVSFPRLVTGVIPIATTARMSAQGIAFNAVARQAILMDPKWRGGDYPDDDPPAAGLALARMIGHITYLSEEAMHRKFGRRPVDGNAGSFVLGADFEVERYLFSQGDRFVRRFDANTYLYITRAMDAFDLEADCGSLAAAFAPCAASYLVVSFTSDWLFPPEQSREIVRALKRGGHDVSYCSLASDQGHDAFLLGGHRLGDVLAGFLERVRRRPLP